MNNEKFTEYPIDKINDSVFDLIGKKWMLITASDGEKVNTMTASWGGLGVMWGKNVAFVFIRPQRYTKEFVDKTDTFSLSFYDEEYRSVLSYMGKVSGRDEDKINKAGLTVKYDDATPYFGEANLVLKVKKLYKQDLIQDCMLDQSLCEKWYPNNDFHTMYVCEIEKVLKK